MAIVVIILSALFVALGAIPPLAATIAAGHASARLQAPVAVHLQAVPTWRVLTGDVDRLQIAVGAVTLGEVPIVGLTAAGGPCRLEGPCQLDTELAIARAKLEPVIRAALTDYTASLAETLGVPGAQVEDLAIELADQAAVSGRFEAFGGLVSVPFRVEGRLDRLDPQTVGLIGATATIHGQAQALGDIPVWTLPALPVADLRVALQRLVVEGDLLKAQLRVDIAHPRELMRALQGAGSRP